MDSVFLCSCTILSLGSVLRPESGHLPTLSESGLILSPFLFLFLRRDERHSATNSHLPSSPISSCVTHRALFRVTRTQCIALLPETRPLGWEVGVQEAIQSHRQVKAPTNNSAIILTPSLNHKSFLPGTPSSGSRVMRRFAIFSLMPQAFEIPPITGLTSLSGPRTRC